MDTTSLPLNPDTGGPYIEKICHVKEGSADKFDINIAVILLSSFGFVALVETARQSIYAGKAPESTKLDSDHEIGLETLQGRREELIRGVDEAKLEGLTVSLLNGHNLSGRWYVPVEALILQGILPLPIHEMFLLSTPTHHQLTANNFPAIFMLGASSARQLRDFVDRHQDEIDDILKSLPGSRSKMTDTTYMLGYAAHMLRTDNPEMTFEEMTDRLYDWKEMDIGFDVEDIPDSQTLNTYYHRYEKIADQLNSSPK